MSALPLHCPHHEVGRCGSCTLLPTPLTTQLARKQEAVAARLADHVPSVAWQPPRGSAPWGFRNKAKLVVGGTAAEPTLGIRDEQGRGVDLRTCGLYPPDLLPVFDRLARFVTRAALPPYDLARRRGELKHLVLTRSAAGELMLRIVLRSEAPLPRVEEHLPGLLADLPRLRVVSANLHPAHAAVLAGPTEIPLTEATLLDMPMGPVTLRLGPDGFFQTNTEVAEALYARATGWLMESGARTVADLYCGVGGFALHAAHAGLEAVGVEISADAVRAAESAAGDLPARFVCADAADPASVTAAAGEVDAVLVNPPRRGLGADLVAALAAGTQRTLVYSSCNPATLARDLAGLTGWRVTRAQLFDMFPHTEHAEVLVELRPARLSA